MPTKAVNLILHPVRLRIIQTLVRRERNTQHIADTLPDVPVSSLYRHIRMLLINGGTGTGFVGSCAKFQNSGQIFVF